MKISAVFALCFLFAFAGQASAVCDRTPDQLRADRIDALRLWTGRVNQDANYYLSIVNLLMTEDHVSRLLQIGQFDPKPVAIEYGMLLFATVGGSPPGVRLKQIFDPASLKWLSDDMVQHTFTLNITAIWNQTRQAYMVQLDGVRQPETIMFEPCTTRIKSSYIINDELAQQVYDMTSASATTAQICFLIQLACPAGSQYEQYSSTAECISFLSSVPAKGVCPHKFASNTTTCRLIHARSALLDPATHCPHTGRNSMTCRDTCLPACTGCHPTNGYCAAVPSPIDVTSSAFECRCKTGYTGDGRTCNANPCSAQWQCNSLGDYNAVTCPADSGNCACASTFSWNSTTAAAAQRKACSCLPNESVIYRNGVAECLPRGRCYEPWQCPQTYNQVKCVQYGSNPLRSYSSCLCNYGFNGGFELPCQCPAPRRVVWSNAFSGEVCLGPLECTEDWHCTTQPKKCVIFSGEKVGTCQQP